MWFDVMRGGWDVGVCNPWGRERVGWCGDGLCPAYTVSYSGHPGAGVEPQGSGLQLSNGGRGIGGLREKFRGARLREAPSWLRLSAIP